MQAQLFAIRVSTEVGFFRRNTEHFKLKTEFRGILTEILRNSVVFSAFSFSHTEFRLWVKKTQVCRKNCTVWSTEDWAHRVDGVPESPGRSSELGTTTPSTASPSGGPHTRLWEGSWGEPIQTKGQTLSYSVYQSLLSAIGCSRTCLYRKVQDFTWTCLHYRGLYWTRTCPHHRDLSCTWTAGACAAPERVYTKRS
jgi:hypothetical protein